MIEALLSLLTSRIGQIILALVVGTTLGWWRTDTSWRTWEKGQEAIRKYNLQVELAREANNARIIAEAATQRVEDDEATIAGLQKQLTDFSKDNANDPCLMDDRLIDAAGRVRQPPAGNRYPKPTRPPKRP